MTITVALTGIDGSGKSTAVKALRAGLAAQDVTSRVIDKWDVVRGSFAECRFLRLADLDDLKVCIAEMPTVSRWPFLYWSMAQSSAHLESSTQVTIFDGHWMKHACAETALGYPARIIEAMVANLPVVDMVILLDIAPELSLARKRGDLTPYECGLDPSLSEAAFLKHQEAVRGRLLVEAERRGWRVLDASAPPRTVHELILRDVQRLGEFSSGRSANGSAAP